MCRSGKLLWPSSNPKGLAIGAALSEDDVSPVMVIGGEIEMLKDITYLGSKLPCDGEITADLYC